MRSPQPRESRSGASLASTTSEHDLPTFAESKVGHIILVRHRGPKWEEGAAGRIVMVVPSLGRLCWLVEYPNGVTDVIRIDNPPCHYTLRSSHASGYTSRQEGDQL